MSPMSPRTAAIETLHRMTSRLADSSLTLDEANVLLPMIHRLVEEISAGGSRATAQESFAWPRVSAPVPSAVESKSLFAGGWDDVSSAHAQNQSRETSGGSIPSAVARSI